MCILALDSLASGRSSVGRAPGLGPGGREFEPRRPDHSTSLHTQVHSSKFTIGIALVGVIVGLGIAKGADIAFPTSGRVITIKAERWEFVPNEIHLTQGEKVTFEIVGVSGTHGFGITEFGINETVLPGETVRVPIPTDTAGEFVFRCSFDCGDGHTGMNGKIIVEESQTAQQ